MKKMLALCLTAMLVLSLFAGCSTNTGGTSNTATTDDKTATDTAATDTATEDTATTDAATTDAAPSDAFDVSEKVDVEFMTYFVQNVSEDDAVLKAVEDKFNMNMKLTISPHNDYGQALNLRIASGDYPDYYRVMDGNTYNQLVEDDMIVNISEYTSKFPLPNLTNHLSMPFAKYYAEDNGFYRVPTYIGNLDHGMYIRKDWLDKLGLEIPKTYDEFRTTLKAIVDADPDGNGTTGLTSYGPEFWLTHIAKSFTGFNGWRKADDGTWEYERTSEGFKEFLKFLNSLYADNLLDPEFATITMEKAMEKLSSGRAAALLHNASLGWWNRIDEPLKNYNPEGELALVAPYPSGPAGAHKVGQLPYYGGTVLSSSASEPKRLRLLQFVDYMCSPEGIDLGLYGVEGVHHTVDANGKKVQNAEAVQKDWGQEISVMLEHFKYGEAYSLMTNPFLVENYEWAGDPNNALVSPVQNFTTERTTELWPAIGEVQTKYFFGFVTGEMNIDTDWDKYLNDMSAAGMDEMKDILKEFMADKPDTLTP